VVFAVVAMTAWVGWRWMFPSDEAQIRAALDRLARAVGTQAEDTTLAAIGRLAALSEDLAPDIRVDARAPLAPIDGRDALVAAVARVRGSVHDLEVRFVDVEVRVDDGQSTARVSATAEARFVRLAGQRPELDARELDIGFGRRDDRWVVTSIAVVDVLIP
jgi:hypothetical protein